MLELDIGNLYQEENQEKSRDADEKRALAHRRVEGFRAERISTYFEMVEPTGRPIIDEILETAQAIRAEGRYSHFVNLGIGGSSLGGEAVMHALARPWQNERQGEKGFSRFYYPDNIDPETNTGLLEILPPKETLVHVASKSGSTAETAAQMLLYYRWLVEHCGEAEARRQMIVSTDPESGDLRELVKQQGWRSLPIPPGVGGRFSVFGSIGLLPMALFGFDVEKFIAGAGKVAERCRGVENNPALELALHLHAQHTQAKRNILVLFIYSDALTRIGDWFVQLWAESIGKNRQAGSTPLRAVGATDQHSQLQLFMDGPDDKVTLFIRSKEFRSQAELSGPGAFAEDSLSTTSTEYLMGASLNELLRVESIATEKALHDAQRPSGILELDGINEESLGALMYFLQLVTVYGGALYGVNPFDQPGVEAGKRLTYGYFGRKGYEAEGEALRAYEGRKRSPIRL